MTDDEQEALSTKYTTPRVAALSSGKFAIFHPFTNGEGMPLRVIVEFEELWEALREAQVDNTAEPVHHQTMEKENPLANIVAALSKPQEPFRRRV